MTAIDSKGEGQVVHSEDAVDLTRLDTVEIDNYHGLTAKTVLVYLSINLLAFAQMLNLVGSGAFARGISAVVGGSSEASWLAQAIAIATVVLGPPVSQATDYWGRKWFLVILNLFGFVGCIIVSRATSMGMVIAGEVIAGLAYGTQPLLYAVVSEILPRRFRPAAQAGINAALGFGGIVALLAGSTMIGNLHEGFRVYWYFAGAILAVSALIIACLYNPPPRTLQLSLTTKEKFGRLDWGAYGLLGSGTTLFVMALSWAENPYSWKSAEVLAPLFLGAALLTGLVIHQLKFKKDGLLHHDLFRGSRNFALVLFVMFMDGMVFYVVNGYFAFEVSVLYETDTFRVGLRFCIAFFSSVTSSALIAIYGSMTKSLRLPIIISFILFVVFFVCMATATTDSSTAVWAYPVFLGLGIGFSLTCLVTIAQLSTPPALIAVASGLIIAIRALGACVGLAIYSSIFNSTLSQQLGTRIAEAVIPLGLSPDYLSSFITALAANDQATLKSIPGVTPQMIGAGVYGLKEAYVVAFRGVWITAGALSAITAIAACFFVKPKHYTMHVDAPLEQDK